MNSNGSGDTPAAGTPEVRPRRRLDSWKEIAGHLRRDVTTVRRWEKREGLPVHRHLHAKLGSVYAFTDEIDEWGRTRRTLLIQAPAAPAQPESAGSESSAVPVPLGDRSWKAWAAVLVLAAFAVAGTLWFHGLSPALSPETRFLLTTDDHVTVSNVAVSPDGASLVYQGARGGYPVGLWLRRLDTTSARQLPGTQRAWFPFWSPDGRSLGFFSDRILKKLDLATGVIETICPAVDGRGATWNRQDEIVFSTPGQPLRIVPARGGAPRAVTKLRGPADLGHAWPQFLPDGRHVLFYVESADPETQGLYVTSLEADAKPKRVVRTTSSGLYVDAGYLLFRQGSQLVAQPFDTRRLTTTGSSFSVADPVLPSFEFRSKVDVAASAGVLVFRAGAAMPRPLVWLNRSGDEVGTVGEPADYGAPILSPDEQHIAVARFNSTPARFVSDIWLLDLVTGQGSKLTSSDDASVTPLWSPNGADVAYASLHGSSTAVYAKATNGDAAARLLLEPAQGGQPESWSSDGRYVTYGVYNRTTRRDTWVLPLFGPRKPFPILDGARSETQSQISPNGRFLAYASDESGRPEVYVTRFPSHEGKWQISYGGGGDPRWRDDGEELFFVGLDRRMMAVAVTTTAAFSFGAPQPLFDAPVSDTTDMRNHYDVTKDGKRFLFAVPRDGGRGAPFTVVSNWRLPRR